MLLTKIMIKNYHQNPKQGKQIRQKKKKNSPETSLKTLSQEDIYRIVRPKYLFIE